MAQVGLLEDNTRIARLCATMLQYAGHQVTVYEHPRECLHALLPSTTVYDGNQSMWKPLAIDKLPVDVLVLDLHLPDIDGVDVLRYLRADSRTQTLPLIFCTAAPPSEVSLAFSIAPDAGFVEKPFTFQQLTSAITDALNAPTRSSRRMENHIFLSSI